MYFDLLDHVHYMFEWKQTIQDDAIHIGFGLHDRDGNYSVWVGVAMQSILDHTDSNVCFHILHDSTLNRSNKRKLMQVANTSQSSIIFHFVDVSKYEEYKQRVGHFSIGSLFRVELPELVSEPKILYLDADILVNCDIKELWDIDIDHYCLAAVRDYGVSHFEATALPVKIGEIDRDAYFNSGILSMNLSRMKEKSNLKEEMISYIENHPDSVYLDQDALNSIYKNETLLLEDQWNYFVRIARDKNEKLEPKIYHYAGTTTCLYTMCAVDFLYFETLMKTPWKYNGSHTMLKRNFGRLNDRVKQLELIVSRLTKDTKFIFYGEENYNMKNLYTFFHANSDKDYRVMEKAGNQGVLNCKSLEDLKSEKNFIVFVYPEADGGRSLGNLEKLGLKNEIDFFVVPRFRSFKDAGYIL